MSTIVEELNVLELLFDQERFSASQFNIIRADLSATQRTIIREYFCHYKTFEEIALALELPLCDIRDGFTIAFKKLDQYQASLLAKFGNVIPFRQQQNITPCHRCTTQLLGSSPEKYCPYCFWDETKDPVTTKDTDGGGNV